MLRPCHRVASSIGRYLTAAAVAIATARSLLAALRDRASRPEASAGAAGDGDAREAGPKREQPVTPMRGRSVWLGQRLLAVVIGVAAVGSLACASALVAWRVSARTGPELADARTVPLTPASNDRFPFWRASAKHPRPRVIITIVGVQPQRATMTVRASLAVPYSLSRWLADERNGARILRKATPQVRIRRRYRAERWRVFFYSRSPFGDVAGTARVADTLPDAAGARMEPSAPLKPATLTLPVIARPDAYPWDWLSGTFDIGLSIPVGLAWRPYGLDTPFLYSLDRGFPVDLTIRASPTLGDMRVRTGSPAPLSVGETIVAPNTRIALAVDRRPSVRFYVSVVLFAPLVLVLAIVATTLLVRGLEAVEVRDLLVGFLAATLTLVPLRAVLVPSSLPGLTFVDWVLAAELLAFVAVGLAALARRTWLA